MNVEQLRELEKLLQRFFDDQLYSLGQDYAVYAALEDVSRKLNEWQREESIGHDLRS